MTGTGGDPGTEGRAALRRGDTAAARAAFVAADPTEPDVLEGLARAAYIDLDFDAGGLRPWESPMAAASPQRRLLGLPSCLRRQQHRI